MGFEAIYKIMWVTLHGMSLLLGGTSLVTLYISFFVPEFGAYAFVTLLAATMITLGLPQIERQPVQGRQIRQIWSYIVSRVPILHRLFKAVRR